MRRLQAVLSMLWFVAAAAAADNDENGNDGRPVLLYSRYYNAEGEGRYLPDGTYKEVLKRLGKEFKVRIHNQPLSKENLEDVSLLLIANPSDKAVGTNAAPPHISAEDRKLLTRFVQVGGGLILMGNQENHNLEIEETNRLLSGFGIQFTNLYTDAKKLVVPQDAPLVGGMRWAYYTGNLLILDPSHRASPTPVVMNDLNQKPIKGSRDQEGVLMASAEYGNGRVIIVTDAGWITDSALDGRGIGDVAIKDQDNWEIFRKLALWAAGNH